MVHTRASNSSVSFQQFFSPTVLPSTVKKKTLQRTKNPACNITAKVQDNEIRLATQLQPLSAFETPSLSTSNSDYSGVLDAVLPSSYSPPPPISSCPSFDTRKKRLLLPSTYTQWSLLNEELSKCIPEFNLSLESCARENKLWNSYVDV
ncbi:hypothetical protein RCL1_004739 [Eukaryota sp. TZLM3-RCL]